MNLSLDDYENFSNSYGTENVIFAKRIDEYHWVDVIEETSDGFEYYALIMCELIEDFCGVEAGGHSPEGAFFRAIGLHDPISTCPYFQVDDPTEEDNGDGSYIARASNNYRLKVGKWPDVTSEVATSTKSRLQAILDDDE